MSAALNLKVLNAVDAKTKTAILKNISSQYGISESEALQEVTVGDCENLLDYMTGSERIATSAIMKRLGLR